MAKIEKNVPSQKMKDVEQKIFESQLSVEELALIEAEALKEVEAENKKSIIASYKEKIKSEARAKALFRDGDDYDGDDKVYVIIQMPACGGEDIRIDGTRFYPGRGYNVSRGLADSLYEIMSRVEQHDLDTIGRSKNNMYNRRYRAN